METVPATRMRWSVWARGMGGEALVLWARDEVFQLFTRDGRPLRRQLHDRRPAGDRRAGQPEAGRAVRARGTEGVLFGSTGVHKELRRLLVESNTVEAVLSLPGGVFQPERVLFLHADADGYKLDANHDNPIETDDLPALVETYDGRIGHWSEWRQRDGEAAWPEKW